MSELLEAVKDSQKFVDYCKSVPYETLRLEIKKIIESVTKRHNPSRNKIAGHVVEGLISRNDHDFIVDQIVKSTVIITDALIIELKK